MSEESKTEEMPQKPTKVENYIFLGLPEAGKTTYFTVMAQTLQNIAVRGNDMKFRFENDATSDFIRAGYSALTQPEPDWPDKTETYDGGYEFSLLQRISIMGLKLPWQLGYRQASVHYHDYPGEAFQKAFGKVESDTYKDQADKMRQQICGARGVFLLMDAEKLFNGGDREPMEETSRHLLKFILENNAKVKLAILFNKLELFGDMAKECKFEEMFRDQYASAYSFLPPRYRFFNVYPIGKLDTNEKCKKVPARPLATHGVIEPVRWMIGFKGRFEE